MCKVSDHYFEYSGCHSKTFWAILFCSPGKYMTESGNMGPNSPFMKIELAIGHKSLGNAEKKCRKPNFDILIGYFLRIFGRFLSGKVIF